MLSVLIVEDDMYTQRFMEKLIVSHPLVGKVFPASEGGQAILIAGEFEIDIAFLDIELSPNNSCNGIEVAKSLKAIQPNITIIFVTGYTHYALDCYSVHPYDYVVKPINKSKIMDILTEVKSLKKNPPVKVAEYKKSMAIKIENKLVYITFEEIFFIEKIGKESYIHTSNEVLTSNYGLIELVKILPGYFERTHKSYIVNMHKIRSIENLGNKSFVVHFAGYDMAACLSRYEYEKKSQLFRCDINR
ncbi:MAG TPA: DNA-binding response regulator [Syntrophomonas sp.]|jgi:two-component system LytT family response regulator|nr:DNA-binding response regulator [Syntrophomonas sp.]